MVKVESPPNKSAVMSKPRPAEVSMASHIVDQSLLATSSTHHVNVPPNHSLDHDLHNATIKQDPERAATLLPSSPPAFPDATAATTTEAIDATAVMAAVAAASSATTSDLETAAAGMLFPARLRILVFILNLKWHMAIF